MIRGFNNVSQNIYLDGLKLQGDMYADSKVDPYFLQRVEVLRGPASVLYGKSNPGGVISSVSKRPQKQPLHELQLQAGNHHEWKTQFDFSDALDDEEALAYRLTGNYYEAHSQQKGEREKRYAIAPSCFGSRRIKPRCCFSCLCKTNHAPVITAGCRAKEL